MLSKVMQEQVTVAEHLPHIYHQAKLSMAYILNMIIPGLENTSQEVLILYLAVQPILIKLIPKLIDLSVSILNKFITVYNPLPFS